MYVNAVLDIDREPTWWGLKNIRENFSYKKQEIRASLLVGIRVWPAIEYMYNHFID